METQFTTKDKKWIKKTIVKTYSKAAKNPDGLFRYPTGHEGLQTLKYDPELLQTLPVEVAASYCGVGNPFTLGSVDKGDEVLDVGCGAGVDTLFSAMMTGASGKVVGLDLTPAMIEQAKKNCSKTDLKNVRFEEGSVENLPFADENFDVVTSNGALNLVPDKARAFSEIYRVLRPGGRLMVADEILTGELPKEKNNIIKSWAQWEGGAIPGKDFLAMLQTAGFKNPELVSKTGFNSSPKTEGVLIRAQKTWSNVTFFNIPDR